MILSLLSLIGNLPSVLRVNLYTSDIPCTIVRNSINIELHHYRTNMPFKFSFKVLHIYIRNITLVYPKGLSRTHD